MKRLALLLVLSAPVAAYAQYAPGSTEKPRVATSEEAAAAFAVRPPDEGSPFFFQRETARKIMAQQTGGQEKRIDAGMNAIYPRSKGSPDSFSSMFTGFFTDMFSSVNFKRTHKGPTTESLQIEPKQFSLGERRELDTTYVIQNNTKKIIRLDYKNGQRIEMLTVDPSGKVIEKWSDDRSFSDQEGVVIINPKERIEYSERVATREMKPGEAYTIKAETVGYSEYTVEKTVVPAP